MRKYRRYLYLIVGIIVVAVVCRLVLFLEGRVLPSQRLQQVRHRCTAPPSGFTKEDLVGTWTHPDSEDVDTLIIREDGKYKQIVHIQYTTKPDVDFESNWQDWRFEYQDDIPYLHMEGMRLCAMNADLDCDSPTGKIAFFDFCRNQSMVANDEAILVVLGTPNQNQSPNNQTLPLRGISLWIPLGYEYTYGYGLKEP